MKRYEDTERNKMDDDDDPVIRAVRATARFTARWHKKQITAIGEDILLVARQTGIEPMAVLHEVMEWLDEKC